MNKCFQAEAQLKRGNCPRNAFQCGSLAARFQRAMVGSLSLAGAKGAGLKTCYHIRVPDMLRHASRSVAVRSAKGRSFAERKATLVERRGEYECSFLRSIDSVR